MSDQEERSVSADSDPVLEWFRPTAKTWVHLSFLVFALSMLSVVVFGPLFPTLMGIVLYEGSLAAAQANAVGRSDGHLVPTFWVVLMAIRGVCAIPLVWFGWYGSVAVLVLVTGLMAPFIAVVVDRARRDWGRSQRKEGRAEAIMNASGKIPTLNEEKPIPAWSRLLAPSSSNQDLLARTRDEVRQINRDLCHVPKSVKGPYIPA